MGGGIPTRAGEPEAAKLSSRPDIATAGRLATLTLVEASRKATLVTVAVGANNIKSTIY